MSVTSTRAPSGPYRSVDDLQQRDELPRHCWTLRYRCQPRRYQNLALHTATSESSHTQTYVSANITDGNANSYWESANNAFPQWCQIDLGSAQTVSRVVLKLPPATAWATRTQTIALTGSLDNSTFISVKAAAIYTFDPATGNTVTITFPAVSLRYLRTTITTNSGWPAGQVSELEAYSS